MITDTSLATRIAQKSQLILRATAAEQNGFTAEARHLFSQAAQLEEAVATDLRSSDNEDWCINAISAASLWTKAGDFDRGRAGFVLVLQECPDINLNSELEWFLSRSAIARALEVRGYTDSEPLPYYLQTHTGPQAHVLVVGIDEYHDSAIPPLAFAERDATAMLKEWDTAFRLLSKGTAAALLGSKATRATILERLKALAHTASPADTVVLHFAGHGATDRTGMEYLVACDTRVDSLAATGISVEELLRALEAINSRQRVVLFDGSFSGRSIGHALDFSDKRKKASNNWLARLPNGVAVLAACQSRQTALESRRLEHGLFTHFLLRWLQESSWGGDAGSSLTRLHQFVRTEVSRCAETEFKVEQEPALEARLADAFLPGFLGYQFEQQRQETRRREISTEFERLVTSPNSSET
jgi:Caspase domain